MAATRTEVGTTTLTFVTDGPGVPSPGGHYSAAVVADDTVYVSGCVGIEETSGTLGADFGRQLQAPLENLRSILAAAGVRLQDVVKTTCYFTDVKHFGEFNAAFATFFGNHKPARTTVTVDLDPGVLFELDAVAVRKARE